MKVTDDVCLELKSSHAYHKIDFEIDTFRGEHDHEWDTKEDPGKSMKNVL